MFVLAIILALLALGAILTSLFIRVTGERKNPTTREYETVELKGPNRLVRLIGFGLGALAVLFVTLSSTYTQDPGEANVLRSWTGEVVGYETTAGLHWKAPWVDTVTFDIRNQRAVFVSEQQPGEGDNAGGTADGPQITVQDAQGVTANIDIAIRYSIKPDAVQDIYAQYGNEENLRSRLIFNDIRSVVRSVPGKFDTIDLLTDRAKVQNSIQDALEERWADDGIIVEDVALQEIRYGEAVTNAYASAQEAQIQVETEQAKLEAAKVSAQQKVVQAQAEADANDILAASLTDRILQQRYLDTLKELAAAGNLVITDGKTMPLVNVGK